jgi:RNA polymerase sigma factor (TIGR02999 family)
MSRATQRDLTELLIAWRGGDETALAELMPKVYRRLKSMAGGFLRRERADHTLQPTALVHEVYIRLVDLERIDWRERVHFLSVCARLMRRILIEHARYHDRAKRGSGVRPLSFEAFGELSSWPEPGLVDLDDALLDLESRDKEMAEIVLLRYFGGLNRDEIGEAMGISARTVTRRGRMARAWLGRYLSRRAGDTPEEARWDGS